MTTQWPHKITFHRKRRSRSSTYTLCGEKNGAQRYESSDGAPAILMKRQKDGDGAVSVCAWREGSRDTHMYVRTPSTPETASIHIEAPGVELSAEELEMIELWSLLG
jgi:hypothetical protein